MSQNFYIDNFLINPNTNKISLDSKEWKIEPKIMEVLLLLKEHQNEVVAREQILDHVWKDSVVVDMVITRAISELRSVFGDRTSSPQFIETIPKRGYRLIAPVVEYEAVSLNKNESRRKILIASAIIAVVLVSIFSFLDKKNTSMDMNSKEYNIRSLTSLKGWEYNPSISPDSKKVVFVWKGEDNVYSINTKSFDDESLTTLVSTKSMLFSPVWTPDQNFITYYKNDNGLVTICNIAAFGGEEQEVLSTKAQLSGLSWSKDGKKMAYVDSDSLGTKSIIWIYDTYEEKSCQLTNPSKTYWGDYYPKFSPDNTKIAFIRTITEGDQDVYMVDLKTKKEFKISSFSSNIFGFDWRDNDNLVLSTNYKGSTSLWEINYTLDKKKKVPLGINNQSPTISNNSLVTEQWTRDVDLWKVELDKLKATSISPLITSTKFDFNPSYSNDNDQIVFVSNRTGSYELWLANSLGKEIKKITSIKKSLLGNARWSPNDELLAFNSRMSNKSNIFIKNIKSKTVYPFADTTYNNLAPFWSRNNNWLYYTSDKSGDWEIWKKPINGSEAPSQITKNGAYYGSQSFDGKYIYFTKFKKPGIWRLDLESKLEKRVVDSLAVSDFANFSVYENGIFYVKRSFDDLNSTIINHYDFETEKKSIILKTKTPIPTNDNAISVSKDGKSIIYGLSNGYNGDLILVENF